MLPAFHSKTPAAPLSYICQAGCRCGHPSGLIRLPDGVPGIERSDENGILLGSRLNLLGDSPMACLCPEIQTEHD